MNHVMSRFRLQYLKHAAHSIRVPCAVSRRAFATRHREPDEVIKVPIGGSGDVDIDIKYPSVRSDEAIPAIFVHLPPGPPLSRSVDSAPPLLEQRNQSASHVSIHLTIKYRLSEPSLTTTRMDLPYCFPQPIHDVCASFDYILTNIVPSLFPSLQAEPDQAPAVYVTGSHLGGALATTLALTEPNDITAVAIHNPLADWVSLEDYLTSVVPATKSKKPIIESESIAAAARELIETRTQLFSSPSGFFDHMASPTLFLRAPGRDTPRTHAEALGLVDPESGEIFPNRDPIDDLCDSQHHTTSDLLTPPATPTSTDPFYSTSFSTDPPRAVRRRKVLRRWPPVGRPEDVLLPYIHIFTSSPTPPSSTVGLPPSTNPHLGARYILAKQAEELATLLRRACFWGRESSFGEARVQLTDLGSLTPETRNPNGGSCVDNEAEAQAAANAMERWLDERVTAEAEERAKERKVLEEMARRER